MKKVSAKKVSVELNNMANNLNNNVRRVVKNDMAINLIRVLLIIYTSFVIPVLDSQTLDVLNNNVVRLVVCALIVYLAFMDVVTSVLLTVAFVLTIHHGKKRVQQVNNNAVNDVDSDMVNKINSLNDVRVENYEDLNNALNGNNAVNGNNLGNEENPFAPVETPVVPEPVAPVVPQPVVPQPVVPEPELNIPEMQVNNAAPVESNNLLGNNLMANVVSNNAMANNAVEDPNNLPAGLDNLPENNLAVFNNAANNVANNSNNNSIESRNEEHPASNTLTDNILNVAVGAEPDANGPSGLTTWQQLYDASENAVPGADIMSQVRSVEDGHSAQGMNGPVGANYARHEGYHYTSGEHLVHNGIRNNAV